MKTIQVLFVIFACLHYVCSQAYSEDDAKYLVRFTGVAYCNKDKLASWSCALCKKIGSITDVSVAYASSSNTLGFTAYDPSKNKIIVCFRGTELLSLKNWISNLYFVHTKSYGSCSTCQVHTGFMEAYKNIQTQIRNSVRALVEKYNTATVHVTGHSLGGALAIFGALDILDNLNIKPRSVYTFGQPRVGNKAFRDYWMSRFPASFRVTHNSDPVPHLPLQPMGFSHPPFEVFYQSNNINYKVCDASGEDKTCADSVPIAINVADHLNYVGFDFTSNQLECI